MDPQLETGITLPPPQTPDLPELSGSDLSEAPSPLDLSNTFSQPSGRRDTGIVQNVSSGITSQLESFEAARETAREQQAAFDALGAPLAGAREQLEDRFGLPDNLRELQDINLQLADLQTQSKLNKAQATAGGAGAVQAQRAITLEDRQAGIRSQGLAARAAVLQGNVQTARSLINDAMTDLYEDREVRLSTARQQLDRAYDVADNKEKQLIDERRRLIDQEEARIQEVKGAVSNAVLAGASQEEVAAFNDPNVSDEQKLALAQEVVARRERSTLAQETELRQAQINSANRANRVKPTTRPTDIIEQDGRKLLVDTQTGEVIQDFGQTDQSNDELQRVKMVDEIQTTDDLLDHPGLNSSVGPTGISRIGVIDAFSGAGDDFRASVDSLTKGLTIDTLVEAKANGATFGALNQQEFSTLADAATKINGWRKTDDDGRTTSFDAPEQAFKDELDVINGYRKLDAVLKGVDPTQVGVVITPDGKYWTESHDGELIQLR